MKRGKSLFGSGFEQNQKLLKQHDQKQYSRILEDLSSRPRLLKQYITNYKKAATESEQLEVYKQFRREQLTYKRFRQNLSDELDQLKSSNPNDQEYKYVRNQLVLAIKKQMNLELEMNDLINTKREKKEDQIARWTKLEGKSTRVQNALDDILRKRDEIIELENSIKECLELLKIIGILVDDQGQKINKIQEEVSRANQFIEKAEVKIDQAKQRQKRATRKRCCVILIGLGAICLILVVLYGVSVISI